MTTTARNNAKNINVECAGVKKNKTPGLCIKPIVSRYRLIINAENAEGPEERNKD